MFDYRVVTEDSAGALGISVRDRLQQGWRLQGGVCVICDGPYRKKFYQAVVMETVDVDLRADKR